MGNINIIVGQCTDGVVIITPLWHWCGHHQILFQHIHLTATYHWFSTHCCWPVVSDIFQSDYWPRLLTFLHFVGMYSKFQLLVIVIFINQKSLQMQIQTWSEDLIKVLVRDIDNDRCIWQLKFVNRAYNKNVKLYLFSIKELYF